MVIQASLFKKISDEEFDGNTASHSVLHDIIKELYDCKFSQQCSFHSCSYNIIGTAKQEGIIVKLKKML